MSNISQAAAIFTEMRAAHKADVKNAFCEIEKLEREGEMTECDLAIEKRKQRAQVDMMDFQGMMQLEQQLIAAFSQITATEGRTNDSVIKNIG